MRKFSRTVLWTMLCNILALVFGLSQAAEYDTIIRGGTVYDGSGSPGVVADVAIRGDRIAAIGDLSGDTAKAEIDAAGQAVAPGFINMLSWAVGSLIQDGRGLSDIKQGVTLEVFGEGWSMGPLPAGEASQALAAEFLGDDFGEIPWKTLGEYLEYLENKGVSPNVASFVGATTVRIHEVGFEDRAPTDAELENMKALVRQAMEEGAMGLGSSLIYPPAFFASTEELVELAKVVGEYDGMYISHMRSEGNRIEESVQELITIAREAGIGAEIYHLKMAGRQNWDKLPAVRKMVEDARAEGLNITTDMYTYVAGGTGLAASFPPWASDGGQKALLERLADPETRARIVAAMGEDADDWENLYYGAGPEGVLLMSTGKDEMKKYMGRTLADIALERGADPSETAVDLVIESEGQIGAMYFLMTEDNVKEQIKLPWMSFGSDAEAQAPEGEFLEQGVHPRAYGNFARLLGKYVREEKVIPLEEAIYKLTSLPAGNLKISDRGRLAKGYLADVVVFDPDTISDRATFEQPQQLAVGMSQVFVNGEQVLKDGEHTGALPGRVIRGPGYKGAGSRVAGAQLNAAEIADLFDGLIPTLMKYNNSPSGVVAVARNDEVLFLAGYGFKDAEALTPADPNATLFRPGSISKLFTWVSVMQMVEQGRLDLDVDVNQYLENFQIKDTFSEPVTLRHIMTHTAGFEDGAVGYLIISDEDRLIPLAQSMERYQPQRVNPPGAQTSYSNYGTALAGLIVANVSGMTFEQYVQTQIFDVLGMDSSSFEEPLPEGLSDNMATGYAVEAGTLKEKPYELISNFGPAGALASTAADMIRFGQAILNGGELNGKRILRADTVQQMLTRNFSHDDRLMGMALGFYETQQNGVRLVGHGGDTSWFHSDLAIDLENDITVYGSFSSTGGGAVRSAVVSAFYDRFFPQTPERPTPPDDFSERAAKYAGAYNFWRRNFSTFEKAAGIASNVQLTPSPDNTLILAFGGNAKQYVEIEENLFQELDPGVTLVSGISPQYLAFQENESGQITGFVMDGLPFMSLQKLPVYATANFNLTLFAASLLLFLGVVLRRFFQRATIRDWRVADRSAYRAAFWTSLLNLLVVVTMGITLVAVGNRLFGEIPAMFKAALVFPVLATLAGIYLLFKCLGVWRKKLLASGWARLRYTLVTLAAGFMCWFYYYWNLLGWQYMT